MFYHTLIEKTFLKLVRISNSTLTQSILFNNFHGLLIDQSRLILKKYLTGYFKLIFFRDNKENKKILHSDYQRENYQSILGFLNKTLNTNDGDHIFLEDTKINFFLGRYVISSLSIDNYDGEFNNKNLYSWRKYLNINLIS